MAKVFEMLAQRWAAGKRVCVGLDSDYRQLPVQLRDTGGGIGQLFAFNKTIIDATHEGALAFKPNIAFYAHEKMDAAAREVLRLTIDYIRRGSPKVPVILDYKRGDIGNTNDGYVREVEFFGPDAITVHSFMGMEAMMPFLKLRNMGIFVLCRTSNPGAEKFQDRPMAITFEEAEQLGGIQTNILLPQYQLIANDVARNWDKVSGNCGLVVGATVPTQLGEVRKIVGDDMWILAPGIGKQKGDLEGTLRHGLNSTGSGLVINSSSGIIFAGGGASFGDSAQEAMFKLTGEINTVLRSLQ